MSVVEHIPTTTRGRLATVVAVAAAWAGLYWLNGQVWDRLLDDLLGLDPDARVTESLHFFLDKVAVGGDCAGLQHADQLGEGFFPAVVGSR